MNRTRRGPSTVTSLTSANCTRIDGRPCSINVWNVQATSSAVTGVPSENFASGRKLNATQLLSSGTSIVSHKWQYPVSISSAEEVSNVSHT